MSISIVHGGPGLPAVTVDAYNAELRDSRGFIGDRASSRAFHAMLADMKARLAGAGGDPLDGVPSTSLPEIDALLAQGTPLQAGVVAGVIEGFAQEFAGVIRRFLRIRGWRDTKRIVVGGGMRGSRAGELAIGRAHSLLMLADIEVDLAPIRSDPDHAGLLGGAHLAPSWIFEGHDSILALDIGGTNVRAGLVDLHLDRAANLSHSTVAASLVWRHKDDAPKRDEAVLRIVDMLRRLERRARRGKLNLAPFIAVGCPGVIAADGSIERGGQNLPGNWESDNFNLPGRLRDAIPRIGKHETHVAMHNDAVVQGLSETPFMQDVASWGVMTIGTGLGNARFTNRRGT